MAVVAAVEKLGTRTSDSALGGGGRAGRDETCLGLGFGSDCAGLRLGWVVGNVPCSLLGTVIPTHRVLFVGLKIEVGKTRGWEREKEAYQFV